MTYKITREELLSVCKGGRPDPYSPRLIEMLEAVNHVRDEYGLPMVPSCFYRTPEWDKAKGRSGNSTHCQLMAVDFDDKDGMLAFWCMNNLDVLAQAGLWMEDPRTTKGWVHLDMKPRKNRIFIP